MMMRNKDDSELISYEVETSRLAKLDAISRKRATKVTKKKENRKYSFTVISNRF